MEPTSPLHLKGNDRLSDAEVSRFQAARLEAQAAIDSLDREIAALRARRQDHEINLQRCDEALSSVRKVPEDVLSSILLSSCDQEGDTPYAMSSSHPAVVASHVCKNWRCVSLSTPKLWSKISITLPDHPLMTPPQAYPHLADDAEARWAARMEQLLDMTHLWISRSGACPLSLVLDLATSFWAEETWGGHGQVPPSDVLAIIKEFITLVCTVSRRWESVDMALFVNSVADIEGILSLKAEDVPLLHTAKLRTYVNVDPMFPPANPPGGGFLMGEALRNLVVLRVPETWRNLSVNWSNIRTLRLGVQGGRADVGSPSTGRIFDALGPLDTLRLFSSCPNLVQCELSITDFDGMQGGMQDWLNAAVDPPRDFGETASLPYLESLTFHRSEPLVDFFASIDAPSLQELEYLDSFVVHTNPATMRLRFSRRFMAAIDRFGTQLTDVRFNMLYLIHDTASIARCFNNLSNLSRLHLDNDVPLSTVGEERNDLDLLEQASKLLLDFLTPKINEDGVSGTTILAVCPKLKHFACALVTRGFTETDLVNFIAKRRGPLKGEELSSINNVRVAFGVLSRMDVRGTLEEMDVDVDDLVLKLTYPEPRSLNIIRGY